MKKIIALSFLAIILLLSSCIVEEQEDDYEEETKYELMAYHSTKRDKVYLLFDEDEKNMIWTSKRSGKAYIYSYSGALEDEITAYYSSGEHYKTYKRNGNYLETYYESGEVCDQYSIDLFFDSYEENKILEGKTFIRYYIETENE